MVFDEVSSLLGEEGKLGLSTILLVASRRPTESGVSFYPLTQISTSYCLRTMP